MALNEAVQRIFEVGLAIRSVTEPMELSERLRLSVDDLLAALDAAVRAAHLGAYDLNQ